MPATIRPTSDPLADGPHDWTEYQIGRAADTCPPHDWTDRTCPTCGATVPAPQGGGLRLPQTSIRHLPIPSTFAGSSA